ncbi:MAG TPA: hypothetical protein VLI06_03010 [Solimonas sp.]|nr:hypothetical protein [Solimonas sp.]
MSKRPLPGDPDGARPPSLALADHLKRLGHAAGDELRKKVRSGISDHFGEFLAQLPPVLAGQGPEGADLALTLSDNHKSWLDTYLQRVDAHILGGKGHRANGAALPERTPAEVTQYREALVNAEAFHRKLVNELNTRVDRIRLTLFLPIYTRALAPVGLVEALSDTADALGWPSSFRPLLFREFEERVLGNLASLYRALIGALRVI